MILTVNAGSSTLKISLYRRRPVRELVLTGSIERLDGEGGSWSIHSDTSNELEVIEDKVSDHSQALEIFLRWMDEHREYSRIAVVGHRVVHGGSSFTTPVVIDDAVVETLSKLIPMDPGHMPQTVACIETIRHARGDLTQIACFDTAFHQTMPRVAKQVPLPRRFESRGLVRHGFHGLSYEYIMQELAAIDSESRSKRTVIAHLGSGGSMVAIRDGRSIDTTMGMTPTGGLMMGTRTGDLDPGMLTFLMQSEHIGVAELDAILNRESGLLGVSGLSGDMRDVQQAAESRVEAREALDLYCHIAKKHLGSMIAVLGGLDRLVFTGGIGEHASEIRAQICDGLGFAGIELDANRNRSHEKIISTDLATTEVRVMQTNEDAVIAHHCEEMIATNESIPSMT